MIDIQKPGDRTTRKVFFIRGVTSLNGTNAELGFGTWFCKTYTEEYLNIYWSRANYTNNAALR